jgi:hypothetical protein
MTTLSKADEKALGSLHGKLAEVLTQAITQGIPIKDRDGLVITDKDGNVMTEPAPAAILNVARQFLKDNKIEAIAAAGSPLGDLSDLPVFDDDNIVPIRKSS